MMDQIPVERCLYCGCEDIGIGWQHGDALVTFKKHGLMGNRLQHLICRRCGAGRTGCPGDRLWQCGGQDHQKPLCF